MTRTLPRRAALGLAERIPAPARLSPTEILTRAFRAEVENVRSRQGADVKPAVLFQWVRGALNALAERCAAVTLNGHEGDLGVDLAGAVLACAQIRTGPHDKIPNPTFLAFDGAPFIEAALAALRADLEAKEPKSEERPKVRRRKKAA